MGGPPLPRAGGNPPASPCNAPADSAAARRPRYAAFKETGDVFDPATAKRLHDFIYSAGYLRDPAEAYTRFRGRLPTTEALLKKRGLDEPGA